MKKRKIIRLILTIALIIFGIFFVTSINGYKNSDIEVLEALHGTELSLRNEEDIIYKYENSTAEICFYYDEDGVACTSYLKKITLFGKAYYKYSRGMNTCMPTFDDQYIRVNRSLYFIMLDNKRFIDRVDSCGYTPDECLIEYTDKNSNYRGDWLFIVDLENNNSSNNKFTNYKKGRLNFY